MSHREEKRAKKEEKHVLQVLAALQVKDITHEAAHSEHGGGDTPPGISAWYWVMVFSSYVSSVMRACISSPA